MCETKSAFDDIPSLIAEMMDSKKISEKVKLRTLRRIISQFQGLCFKKLTMGIAFRVKIVLAMANLSRSKQARANLARMKEAWDKLFDASVSVSMLP